MYLTMERRKEQTDKVAHAHKKRVSGSDKVMLIEQDEEENPNPAETVNGLAGHTLISKILTHVFLQSECQTRTGEQPRTRDMDV